MTSPRILVVEDEAIIAMDIRQKLEQLGYTVVAEVSSGELAIAKARELHPQLVLMDIRLKSAMDGIHAAEQIRTQMAIPVIYLTAHMDGETLQRAKTTEPFGYLLKPLDERELHIAVEMALYKHRMDQEREQFRARLCEVQKREAVGRLAGGIAHEFNNLTTVIIGQSQFLQQSIHPMDPLHSGLDDIRKAGIRAASLTEQLLAFTRRQFHRPAVLDLNEQIAARLNVLKDLLGETIQLDVRLAADLGCVRMDPAQLDQVLLALVLNTRDAMPAGGTFTIETTNVTRAERERHQGVDLPPGSYVRCMVRDTGCGMDAETRARCFEPFFTTKGPDKGVGLGLSAVQGIVQQNGGQITVASEPGQGTTFTIDLPLAKETMEGDAAKEEASPGP